MKSLSDIKIGPLPMKSLPLLPYWILNSITYSSTWALPWVAMPVMFLIVPRSTVRCWSKSEFSAVQADPPHRTAFKADLWLDSEVAFTCNSLTNFKNTKRQAQWPETEIREFELKFASKKFVKSHQVNLPLIVAWGEPDIDYRVSPADICHSRWPNFYIHFSGTGR